MGTDFLKTTDKINLALSIVIYLYVIVLASVAIHEVTERPGGSYRRFAEVLASFSIALTVVLLLIQGVVFLDRGSIDVR